MSSVLRFCFMTERLGCVASETNRCFCLRLKALFILFFAFSSVCYETFSIETLKKYYQTEFNKILTIAKVFDAVTSVTPVPLHKNMNKIVQT